jgi:hypothetical protein
MEWNAKKTQYVLATLFTSTLYSKPRWPGHLLLTGYDSRPTRKLGPEKS